MIYLEHIRQFYSQYVQEEVTEIQTKLFMGVTVRNVGYVCSLTGVAHPWM